MDLLTVLQVLDSTIRLATPLLLACLAGLFSERAGIFDIGLEGKMLAAAFFSGAVAYTSGSVWVGLLAGVAASLALSGIHGLASITFRGNQLISGVAINFLASGMTVVIAQDWFREGGRTPSLEGDARFTPVDLPLSGLDIPIIGPIYSELVSGHTEQSGNGLRRPSPPAPSARPSTRRGRPCGGRIPTRCHTRTARARSGRSSPGSGRCGTPPNAGRG